MGAEIFAAKLGREPMEAATADVRHVGRRELTEDNTTPAQLGLCPA